MRTPHTAVWKGKRVRVTMKDGETFIDKFVERKGRFVYFEEHGERRRGQIKAFSIYKGEQHT